MIYPVVYEEHEGTVIASIPDLPGTHDEGMTAEVARARVTGAAINMIQSLMDDKEDVPDPSPIDGRATIALPSQVWAKVLLYRAMRAKGWRKADLARALNLDPKGVDRLLNLFHQSRPEALDAAFAAVGKVLVQVLEDAA